MDGTHPPSGAPSTEMDETHPPSGAPKAAGGMITGGGGVFTAEVGWSGRVGFLFI